MLIKVMALITKKLEAMHAGMPGSEQEPSIAAVGDDEPTEEPSAPPFGGGEEEPAEKPSFGGGEEEPEEKPEPEEPAEPKDKKKSKDDEEDTVSESTQTLPPNKGAYKTVAPHSYTDEEENKALNIQTDPQVNEKKEKKDKKWIQKAVNPKHKGYCTPMTKSTCTPRRKALAKRFKKGIDETQVNMKMGKSYRVAPETQAQVTEPDQPARVNQYTPNYPVKEGHKVQARSYKTVNDMDNKPENVEDPENPMS